LGLLFEDVVELELPFFRLFFGTLLLKIVQRIPDYFRGYVVRHEPA